jgi:hypothetical protein
MKITLPAIILEQARVRHITRIARCERGYTLMETVVAMGILLGVLLPLGVFIGNLLLDRRPEMTQRALLEAESMMNSTISSGEYSDTTVDYASGLQLRRVVLQNRPTTEVRIFVYAPAKRETALVFLSRHVAVDHGAAARTLP